MTLISNNASNLEIIENKARTCGGRWVEVWQHSGQVQRRALVLVFDEPSQEYGLDGGRISKLRLKKYEAGFVSMEANYDRGWDKQPTTKEATTLLDEIKNIYK